MIEPTAVLLLLRSPMPTFVLIPKQAVLLIMYYQTDIMALFLSAVPALLFNTRALYNTMRTKGISVYFAKLRFSPGYPEVSLLNKNGQGMEQLGLLAEDHILPELGRQPNELIIIARHAGAFCGTDLQVRLSAKGIDTLIMVGATSTGVMLPSIVHAGDAGYRLFTVKDCCYDPDPIVYEYPFATAFESRTTVLSLADTLSLLE